MRLPSADAADAATAAISARLLSNDPVLSGEEEKTSKCIFPASQENGGGGDDCNSFFVA